MERTFEISIAGVNKLTEDKFKATYLINAETMGDAVRKLGSQNNILSIESLTGKVYNKKIENISYKDNGVRLIFAHVPNFEFSNKLFP